MAWVDATKPPFGEQALDLARYMLTEYGEELDNISTAKLATIIDKWMSQYNDTKTVGSRTVATEFNGT